MTDLPSSIYRIQVNRHFPLKRVIEVLPYLQDLGIEAIYCSPLFQCESDHGYDITNPNLINPLIGGEVDFNALCTQLKQLKMQQLLDVVPNHMGIKGKNNIWWLNILEYGRSSLYAHFFDINWNSLLPELKNKVLLPILHQSYGKVLENGEIQLLFENGFWISYQDYSLPVCPGHYSFILEKLSPLHPEQEPEWGQCIELANEGNKQECIACINNSPAATMRIQQLLTLFNGKKGDNHSFDLLHDLLERQHYRLAHWLVAGQEINYRRFFNINELVAVHIEQKDVFEAHHRFVISLVTTNQVQGLRIDHPDGLYDPETYFERLAARGPSFIFAEKILDFQEQLSSDWKVSGTVGYDFLNILSGLFVQKKNEKAFNHIYTHFIGDPLNFNALLYERKKWFIQVHMASEINFLGFLLDRLAEKNRYYRDFTRPELTRAIQEVIAYFPVYRTYVKPGHEVRKQDRNAILHAVEMARQKTPEIDNSIYNYLQACLLLEFTEIKEQNLPEAIDFTLRFQQLTAPITAKGLEDSTYYIYNRLISLNEVGSNPQHFGSSKEEFHQFNKEKLQKWPLGLLASSTHDTKYGEDVRMRLHVLSELPKIWTSHLKTWQKANEKYKTAVHNTLIPEPNTEYLIYQMLLGIWPAPFERLWSLVFKVIREAGIYSSWRSPNQEYDKAVKEFLENLITPGPENSFYPSFLEFQQKIALYGRWNSLSALLLKVCSAGIVDIYQGNENWQLCLMDPDNRQPFTPSLFQEPPPFPRVEWVHTLFKNSDNGLIKGFTTSCLLNFRKKYKELFLYGDYIPLSVTRERQENLIALMRCKGEQRVIGIAGRFFTNLPLNTDQLPLGESCWGTASLELPKELENTTWVDILTGASFHTKKHKGKSILPIAEILTTLPYCLLEAL